MRYFAWMAVVVVTLFAGCKTTSSARLLESTPAGGCVAVPRNTEHYMAQAHELIQAQCPGGYNIVAQKEVVVGQTTTHNKQQSTKEVPLVKGLVMDVQQTTRDSTTVRDRTEWHVWYEKK